MVFKIRYKRLLKKIKNGLIMDFFCYLSKVKIL